MPRTITCKRCGQRRKHHAHGMCQSCYDRENREHRKNDPTRICKKCGRLKEQRAGGLCHRCYDKTHPQKKVVCKECGKLKEHCARGLCKCCYTKEKNKRRKNDLIEMFGGRCLRCGYDRNPTVLSFHHLDPSQKAFNVSGIDLSTYSWDRLVEEAKKCLLLCHNCHGEEHWRIGNGSKSRRSRISVRKRKLTLLRWRLHDNVRCERCGYKKNLACLVFHHKRPSTKAFSINDALKTPNKIPWHLIQREARKCAVLCRNCHVDHHNPMTGQTFTGHSIQNTHFGSALSPS